MADGVREFGRQSPRQRFFMKRHILNSAVPVLALLLLLPVTFALGQERKSVHLSGLINDYSPLSANVKGSPWEMHGQWSMELGPDRETADFSADMTMSGFGRTAEGAVDPTQPLVNPHTHHIRLTKIKISWDMIGCPTYATPVPTSGFQISGTVSLLTGNGNNAPFETKPPSSVLQVCVTGVDNAPYSVANANITLVFTGDATSHFGPQPIHGVVKMAASDPDDKDWDFDHRGR
jgi:hypothetical protein